MSKPHVLSMKQYLAAGGDALFSGFACPFNKEVEDFLKNKAVQSNKLNASVSYLVVDSETAVLLGYFTLVLKPFTIHETGWLIDGPNIPGRPFWVMRHRTPLLT